jgi:hypothetical protein
MMANLAKLLSTTIGTDLQKFDTYDVLGQLEKTVWVQVGGGKTTQLDLSVRVIRPRLDVAIMSKGDVIDFGSVLTGRRSKTRTFAISSTCGLTLNFEIFLSHKEFEVDVARGVLHPLTAQEISLGFFSLEDVHIKNGCLTIKTSISDSDIKLAPFTIPLIVVATDCWIDLEELRPIDFRKQFVVSEDYGAVLLKPALGRQATIHSKSFLVKNLYSQPVEFSLSFPGNEDSSGPFCFSHGCKRNGIVPIGGSEQISLDFHPLEMSRFESHVMVSTPVGQFKVDLFGEGVKPSISIKPAQNFNEQIMHFGSIDVTTVGPPTTRTQEYTVKNTCSESNLQLQVIIRTSGGEASKCFTTAGGDMELQAGEESSFTVVAEPNADRVYQGSIEIRCLNNDTTLAHAALHCHGYRPKVVFLKDGFDCGKQPVKENKCYHIPVQNYGHTDITVNIKYSLINCVTSNVDNSPEIARLDAVLFDGPKMLNLGPGEMKNVPVHVVGFCPCRFRGSLKLVSSTNQEVVISECELFGHQIKIHMSKNLRNILATEFIPARLPDGVSNTSEEYLDRVLRPQDRLYNDPCMLSLLRFFPHLPRSPHACSSQDKECFYKTHRSDGGTSRLHTTTFATRGDTSSYVTEIRSQKIRKMA